MISFTRKNKQDDSKNNYNTTDAGYSDYSDYGTDYVSGDFGEAIDETAEYTEPGAVDPKPEKDLGKSTIKLMKFTTPAEREQVAECLKCGYAVIFELDEIDRSDWFRVIDYIQGAIYMIGGTISRFSEYALIAAPKNFDVSKLELDDLPSAENEETVAEEETDVTEEETVADAE